MDHGSWHGGSLLEWYVSRKKICKHCCLWIAGGNILQKQLVLGNIFLELTSLFTGWGLFPSFTSRKCSGEIMAPMLRMSAYLSSSAVKVVPGSPVKGPRPGRAPAVRDGSGICPGIIARDTIPKSRGGKKETISYYKKLSSNSKQGTICLFLLKYLVPRKPIHTKLIA